ncbi:MAG: MFS transporter [Candidatus Thermoplasmatota archaeon]|nr:MFS transporter [Candidatus Thermoplasmatota archaeon]
MHGKAIFVHYTRAVYAMNWFNIAPGLIYIAQDFHATITSLGILTTVFYAGVGAFQLPGGALAARYGNRIIAGLGISILGVATLLSSFSPNIVFLSSMRFIEGFGSALFFSPAISSLRSIVPEERYAFHVNIYNGSFSIGAGMGVFIWGYLDGIGYIGWRGGFLIAGIITLFSGIMYLIILAGTGESVRRGKDLLRNMVKAMRIKGIWFLSLSCMGVVIADIVIGQLLVYYLEFRGFSSGDSSIADSLFLVFGFVGGILGAFTARTVGSSRKYLGMVTLMTIVSLFILPFLGTIYLYYLLSIVLGILIVVAFSILYTIVGISQRDLSLLAFSLSITNFIQQLIGAAWPSVFGFIKAYSDYTVSWISMGIIGIAFIPLITLAGKDSFSPKGKE